MSLVNDYIHDLTCRKKPKDQMYKYMISIGITSDRGCACGSEIGSENRSAAAVTGGLGAHVVTCSEMCERRWRSFSKVRGTAALVLAEMMHEYQLGLVHE